MIRIKKLSSKEKDECCDYCNQADDDPGDLCNKCRDTVRLYDAYFFSGNMEGFYDGIGFAFALDKQGVMFFLQLNHKLIFSDDNGIPSVQ